MDILTEKNIPTSLDNLSDDINDLRYFVLDYSSKDNVDFFAVPLLFMESFYSPSADIKIGPYRVQVPLSWSIIIGEKDYSDLEIATIQNCLDKDFQTIVFNPISGFRPQYHTIEILNIYPDVVWYVPRLKQGHILTVPIEKKNAPQCAFFLKDTQKMPEQLDITKIF